MVISARIKRLEDELGTSGCGPRRRRVCEDGAKLGHRAVYADFPNWSQRGRTCDACGRETTEFTLVRSIDPEAL